MLAPDSLCPEGARVSYPKSFKELNSVRDDPNSPLAQDFSHFVGLLLVAAFYGDCEAAPRGLTEFCLNLTSCIKACTKDEKTLTNHKRRLAFAEMVIMQNQLPPLPQLQGIDRALGWAWYWARKNRPWRDQLSAALERLDSSWREEAEKIANKVCSLVQSAAFRVLVVGHSHVAQRVLENAGGLLGQSYVFCPGPTDLIEGRIRCGYCELPSGVKAVMRGEAFRLLDTGRIDMLWIATCSYTEDRKLAWVTRGAWELIEYASRKGIQRVYPLAGQHKCIGCEVASYCTRPGCAYVDILPVRLYDPSFLA